jgi:AcrR family transcriptional regulator
MTREEAPRKEKTRAEIIKAAYRLFLENGFHGTSMRPIALQAGISLGGIYNHFASKEEIFISIFYEFHPYHELLEQLNLAKGETLEEFLMDAARRFNTTILRRPEDFLKLLFIELIEFNAQHISIFFDQLYPQLEQLAAKIFARRPELREYPPFVLLRAFLGLIFSYLMTEWMFGSYFPREKQVGDLDAFVDIFLHGVLSGYKPGGSE